MAILYFNNASTGDTDWNNTSNWWDGPGGGGTNGYSPGAGDTLYIETDCSQGIPTNLQYEIYTNAYFGMPGGNTIPLGYNLTVEAGGSLGIVDLTINGALNINYSNTLGGSITVGSTGNIYCVGDCTFAQTITNNGNITSGGGSLDFTSSTAINGATGVISVTTGQLQVNTGAVLTNNGTITLGEVYAFLFGTLVNNNTFTVSNTTGLVIRPNANFTNNGTFNFGSLYSTKFKGRIFPQVPSSASWGNALL